eukprot:m51a1_g11647 hypothetical protein (384) ;mRNA; f:1807-13661
MGEFLPDADQPKGHTTVNLHLGWSHCSFWLKLVSDLLSKGHGNSALPSLKLFYYIWLTDFPWLRCVKRKGEHRVCSICAAYWDQVCNHALTPEELMSLRMSQSQHRSDFTHERTFVVQECNACRSDAANRWCIIIDGMTAPNLPCLRCNYNNWGNCPRPGLLIMGVLDYTFNQVRYLLSMSGLWPKNQDLIGTTLLLHIVEHLREQSEEEVVVVERKGKEEEDDEEEDDDEEVLADDYKGTSCASQSDEDQRRVLQEKQQISALMKKSRDLLIIFTAKPSEECAHQPCTFGEVRAGFKAMQMLLAGTLSNLIMRMNALTCTVEAGTQSRELMLREKLMLGIPVPELENLPPDRGPYTAALSAIMARPITSQIEQWTKVNYHPL